MVGQSAAAFARAVELAGDAPRREDVLAALQPEAFSCLRDARYDSSEQARRARASNNCEGGRFPRAVVLRPVLERRAREAFVRDSVAGRRCTFVR